MRRAIDQLDYGMPLHNLLYLVGIIFFCYFYTAIIFNPDDVAENMRKYGGFIPGIRPGKRTAEYIDTILARITLVGAVYLAIVALLPQFLISGFKVAPIPFIGETLDALLPRFITAGHGRAVLLRRHVAADHRRRGDGHGAAGRVAADHAALRRVHEEDAHSRAAGTVGAAVEPACADMALNVVMLGPPGAGKGTQADGSRGPRAAEDLDGRHPARGGPGADTPLGLRRQGDDGRAASWSATTSMIGIVGERLSARTRANGFVLDGFPRTVAAGDGARRIDGRRGGPLVVVDIVVPEEAGAAARGAAHLRQCGANAPVECDGGVREVRRRAGARASTTATGSCASG